MEQPKELTLETLESLIKDMDIPSVEAYNGLYKLHPSGIICTEKFLEEFDEEFIKAIKKNYGSKRINDR